MKSKDMSIDFTIDESRKIFHNLKDNINRLQKQNSILSRGRLIDYNNLVEELPKTKQGNISWTKLKNEPEKARTIYRDLFNMQKSGRFSSREIEARERTYNNYINSIKSKADIDNESAGIDIGELEGRAYGILDALYDNVGIILDKTQRYEYKDKVIEMMYEGKSYRDIINELTDIYNKEYEENINKEYEYRSTSGEIDIRDPKSTFDWNDIFGG